MLTKATTSCFKMLPACSSSPKHLRQLAKPDGTAAAQTCRPKDSSSPETARPCNVRYHRAHSQQHWPSRLRSSQDSKPLACQPLCRRSHFNQRKRRCVQPSPSLLAEKALCCFTSGSCSRRPGPAAREAR